MNTRKMTLSAILMAVGYILHQIVPGIPFLGGMKMDFLLVMMFFSIFMMDTYREVLAVAMVCGIISAMTTTFPGGQIANLVDKLITGSLVYFVYNNVAKSLPKTIKVSVIALLGTIVSGGIFLSVGLQVSGAPISFLDLFIAIVLPTSVLNMVLALFMEKIMERAGYKLLKKA
ncbi:tryptophan transporter [Proteiniclasticum sp.]|uniref:tryptophan transporter n=1 Tax=Proteiniclasticum sp. TaxID=2053595 RepID=UPI0028A0F1B5|nr:tryptophan transporter [Proteiniclasticum sp.]